MDLRLPPRIARLIFALCLVVACKTSGSGSSAPGGSSADPNCSSKNATSCPAATSCQLVGTVCSGTATFCGQFKSQTNCPAGSCAWSGATAACGVLSAAASASVTATPTPAPDGSSVAAPTPTPTPAPVASGYCTPFTTAQLCAAGPGCVWSGTTCQASTSLFGPRPTTCSPLNSAELCAAGLGCVWTGTSCVRPKVGLGTVFANGDGLTDVGTSSSGLVNCHFSAILQNDGNLVLFQGSSPIWSTQTAGKGVAKMAFQSDGNLVLYNSANSSIWSTRTFNRGAAALLLSTSGSLVIVDGAGNILWNSGPAVNGCQ